MLIVLSGLPGVGKTTIARELARTLGALHLRIDTIEQALRDAGYDVQGQGYRVAHAIAEDNLRLGHSVIADCVNPWPLTRAEWRAVAERAAVRVLDVEIVCTDRDEHQRRVETRAPDIAGLSLPTWNDVIGRDYHAWAEGVLVIDTARVSASDAAATIAAAVRRQ